MTILFDLSTPESRVLESFLIVSVSPSDQSAPPLATSVPHCWVHEQLHSLLLRNWTLYSYIIASFVICDSCGLKSMLSNRSIAFYFLLVFPVAWTPFWTPYSQSTYVFTARSVSCKKHIVGSFVCFLIHCAALCLWLRISDLCKSNVLIIGKDSQMPFFTYFVIFVPFILLCYLHWWLASFSPLMISFLTLFICFIYYQFLFGDYRAVHKTYL